MLCLMGAIITKIQKRQYLVSFVLVGKSIRFFLFLGELLLRYLSNVFDDIYSDVIKDSANEHRVVNTSLAIVGLIHKVWEPLQIKSKLSVYVAVGIPLKPI
jgi:hypothetical protein